MRASSNEPKKGSGPFFPEGLRLDVKRVLTPFSLVVAILLLAACQTTPSGPLHPGGYLDADGGRIVITSHRCFTYPPAAATEGRQGTTRVRLAVDAQGQMSEPAIAQSSGHGDIDQAALAF